MAGGGNFIHRVMSYVANELIVSGLANSPRFQRFAVRTSKKIDSLAEIAAKKKKELAEQMKDVSKNIEVVIQEPVMPVAVVAARELYSGFDLLAKWGLKFIFTEFRS
ncbi:UvrABC system C protein [Perilla frutescens var. hirtella]|uniref:UvrABC system C protein n=1 Tax=Perilla frutescens var. hirtella TaxID=608512 RepID=A0AAD4P3J0_PERFH|nr:UvrABC system C protein [Perilla frutescens var. frutescens]KAH6824757.1 UvrABC system C protein [Perilla frutescens var. hirtella]